MAGSRIGGAIKEVARWFLMGAISNAVAWAIIFGASGGSEEEVWKVGRVLLAIILCAFIILSRQLDALEEKLTKK